MLKILNYDGRQFHICIRMNTEFYQKVAFVHKEWPSVKEFYENQAIKSLFAS